MDSNHLPYSSKLRAKLAREAAWRPLEAALLCALQSGPHPLIRADVISAGELIRYLAAGEQIYDITPRQVSRALRREGFQQCISTRAKALSLWHRYGMLDGEAVQLAESRLRESLTRPVREERLNGEQKLTMEDF